MTNYDANDVQQVLASILRSVCTPLDVIFQEYQLVNSNIYNRINAPDHYRVQHFVQSASKLNRSVLHGKTLAQQAAIINSAIRAFRVMTNLGEDG